MARVRPIAPVAIALAAIAGAGLAGAASAAVGVDTAAEPGLWDRVMAWIFTEQRAWHHDLVTQMRGLGDSGSQATAWALVLASFLYGLFHAAGPGHGKVVLTSYLFSHRQRVGRGVGLAAASAFCQGIVAVVLVYGLLYLTDLLPRDTRTAVDWTERGSFVLLAALGLWLAGRAARDGLRAWRAGAAGAHRHHDHDHGHLGHGHHGHEHGPGCGHSHGPSASQIESAGSLRGAIAVILSIGLRPCSGAVLVLVLAQAMGLPLAGLAAVAAMSCGTGLAVAALALVAVHARRWAASLAGAGGDGGSIGRGAVAAGLAVRLAGGLVILALGASLFAASFAPAHPLGM